MKFTERHIFGPNGEIHSVDPGDLHLDRVIKTPEDFGLTEDEVLSYDDEYNLWDKIMKKGYVHGEYHPPHWDTDGRHLHVLANVATRHGTPWKFNAALRTLHKHYSENPGERFQIQIMADGRKDDDAILTKIQDITGGKKTLTTLEHIEKYVGMKKQDESTPRVKRITRSTDEEEIKSRLGREPRMGQGNMTKAEWDFWRRKGLGDSYIPRLKSFMRFIKE